MFAAAALPMKPSIQASLFDDPTQPSSASDLLQIDQGPTTLSPAQRSFNRLTQQLARARLLLEQWTQTQQRIGERVLAEMAPDTELLFALQRQLIDQLDLLLTHPPAGLKLTRRKRDALIEFLLLRIEDSAGEGEDEALEDLYRHYSGIGLKDRRQMDQDLELQFAEHVASELYGDEVVADHSAASAEELWRHVQECVDDRNQADQREREARAAERKTRRRPSAAELQREQARQAASASLREIYRRLVSTLHPDRESDPEQRNRKTGLMKQINKAYQDNDLLTLLTLQIEVEQINASTLAALPTERLQHYNQVLREQLRTLQDELSARARQLEDQLGAHHREHVREPRDATRLFERQLKDLRQLLGQFKSTLAALANPHLRSAEIDAIAAAMSRR